MKKAFLVEFVVKTRVIVDVPEDSSAGYGNNIGEEEGPIIEAARDKISSDVRNYIIGENVSLLIEDEECPYDPYYDE